MSKCNNDKVRSFLTTPTSRLRAKYDKIQEAENERESKFLGKTLYKAKIIGVPRQIQANVNASNKPSEDGIIYVSKVQIKLEAADNSLPDPVDASTAKQASQIINSHSSALVPQSLAGALQAGDIVIVEYMTPYTQDTSQVPKIKSKIKTDKTYHDALQAVFANGSGIEQFFQGAEFKPVSSDLPTSMIESIQKINNRSLPMKIMNISADADQQRGKIQHGAIDIAAPVGEWVYAIGDGKITKIVPIHTYSGDNAYFKNFGGKSSSRCGSQINMSIKGGTQEFKVTYCHLSDIETTLQVGSKVVGGAKIGKSGGAKGDIPNKVGKGGGNTTGPHLHLSIVPLGNKEKNNYRNSDNLYNTWWNGSTTPTE